MKVAIDISPYFYSVRGVTRYIRCLISALRALPDTGLEIEEIGYRIANTGYAQPMRALKTAGREFVWRPWIAPEQIRRSEAAVFHAAGDSCIPTGRGVPKLSTLHDLEPFHTPDRYRWWTKLRFPLGVRGITESDRIICVSQSTADDAMKFLGYPADRIDVIHLGSYFAADSPEEAPLEKLPDTYFLFVSALEPGKNLALLNQAYRLAEAKGVKLPPLLVVGERVKGVSHEGEPPESWRYLGRCSDKILAYVYRRALALLAPTKYEGFGLPILEAMTLGIPVICSPLSSLPEVGGDVPLYADQTPDSYLQKMRQLMESPALRVERVQAGLSQAARFSWERCAAQTLEVYRGLARPG